MDLEQNNKSVCLVLFLFVAHYRFLKLKNSLVAQNFLEAWIQKFFNEVLLILFLEEFLELSKNIRQLI